MRSNTRVTLIPMFMILSWSLSVAQTTQSRPSGRQMLRFNADEAVLLREIGTLVTLEAEGKKLKVRVLPVPEGPDIDVKEGDEVGMANGKRIGTIVQLRKVYDATKAGEEFKLGLRRDGRTHIVAFERKEDGDMEGGGHMVVRNGPGGENEDIFPALGFGIVTSDGKTTVNLMMPSAPEELAEGDEVVSINGKDVKTSADFSRELDATEIGGKLSMTFRRGDKEYTVTMERPEPPRGMRMIRR